MKRALYIFTALLVMTACSEEFDLNTKTADKTYLCVEAILNNMPTPQTVRLTESIDYQSKSEAPTVSGATVVVSDGTDTFTFAESKDEPGSYNSPRGFRCSKGKTYRITIKCKLSNGDEGTYEAESAMEDEGFQIDRIDYKYLGAVTDSTWVLGVWGKDAPQTSYFLISTAVNGAMAPVSSMMERVLLMPDTYFNSSYISGFPIGYLYQTADQFEKFGTCAKMLEKGDIVSLIVYSMPKDFYDFVMSLSTSASGTSIPIISSQPANLPTNFTGGNVMGFFTVCPVTIASCFVDDPERAEFK